MLLAVFCPLGEKNFKTKSGYDNRSAVFHDICCSLSSKNPTKRKHARKVTTVFLLFLWFERGEVSAFFCVSFLGLGGGGVWRVGVGDLGSVSMDFRFISGRMIYFSLSRTLSLQTAHGRMCVCKRERERKRELRTQNFITQG